MSGWRKEEILRQIQRRARSYTPEWRFDLENPDIGTALALVYAGMFEGTLERFEKIPMKNRIAFLNALGAGMLPAMSGAGYVYFNMVNEEVDGVELEAGTVVSADVPDSPEGQVEFETIDDLYVTPAVLSRIYQICGSRDQICRIYPKDIEEETAWPVTFFSNQYSNLQEHILYLSHSVLFEIYGEGSIQMKWKIPGDASQSGEYLEALQKEEVAVFEYYSEDGWKCFWRQELTEGALLFQKSEEQPAFCRVELAGVPDFWIRCRIWKQEIFDRMRLSSIELTSRNQGMLPDSIYGAGEECNIHEYFPFGERLDLYSEVYFGCQEVLSKRGAQITLSFGIDFVRIPLDGEKKQITWEWVMKKSDFKPDLEFDVTIGSVIWEYYNGSGWTRLFPGNSYQKIFSAEKGVVGQYQTMEFTCPEDMQPVLINAAEAYYIRGRITKINNLYKMTGNYIVPLLSNTLFRYQYTESRTPEYVVLENNMDRLCMPGRDLFAGEEVLPFTKAEVNEMAVYFGFGTAPVGNPLKMLFLLGNNEEQSRRHLLWEYWNGRRWKNLNLIDETENLSRTGIVTFSGQPDSRKKKLFGEEKYWLRVRDVSDVHFDTGEEFLPVVRGIYMNAAAIRNVGKGGEYTNLKEGMVNKMSRSAGYIREVSNPEALAGGCDVETLQQAVHRNSAALRHQNRAVVRKDYEELAMLASREVQYAKCFTGYGAKGEPLHGAVTLVVLQKAFRQSGAGFYKVKQQILDYMQDKISQTPLDNRKFFVVEPVFAKLCVYAELSVRDFNKVFAVKKEVLGRLEDFFRPAGETDGGWEIGAFPDNMQIQNAINDVPGLVSIRSIMLTAYTSSAAGCREVDVEKIKKNRYVLPVNGIHELVITVNAQ